MAVHPNTNSQSANVYHDTVSVCGCVYVYEPLCIIAVDIREIKEVRDGIGSKDFERQPEELRKLDQFCCYVIYYGAEFKLKTLSVAGNLSWREREREREGEKRENEREKEERREKGMSVLVTPYTNKFWGENYLGGGGVGGLLPGKNFPRENSNTDCPFCSSWVYV